MLKLIFPTVYLVCFHLLQLPAEVRPNEHDLRVWLERGIAANRANSQDLNQGRWFGRIVAAYVQLGDMQAAERLLQSLSSRLPDVAPDAIGVSRESIRTQAAMAAIFRLTFHGRTSPPAPILRKLPNQQQRDKAWVTTIRLLARRQQFATAIQQTEHVITPAERNNAWYAIITFQAYAGDYKSARANLDRLQNFDDQNRRADALRVIERCERKKYAMAPVKPPRYTRHAWKEMLVSSAQFHNAEVAFSDSLDGDAQRQSLRQLVEKLRGKMAGPNAKKDLKWAVQTIHELPDNRARVMALLLLADLAAEATWQRQATQLVDDALESLRAQEAQDASKPEIAVRLNIGNALLSATVPQACVAIYLECGRVKRAIQFAIDYRDEFVWGALSADLASRRRFDELEHAFKKIDSPKERAVFCIGVLDAILDKSGTDGRTEQSSPRKKLADPVAAPPTE